MSQLHPTNLIGGAVRRVCTSLLILILAGALCHVALAYGPLPGEWTGWLVSDPWGGMYLYNGCWVYPIKQAVVPKLRKHSGKPAVIRVTNTYGLWTPGPTRIDEASYVKPAEFGELKALTLLASVSRKQRDDEKVAVTLTLQNKTGLTARYVPAQLTVIVLAKGTSKGPVRRRLYDGKSRPVREGYWIGRYETTVKDKIAKMRLRNMTWYDKIDPSKSYTMTILLALPPGEYALWAGYGDPSFWDGMSLMSKVHSFLVVKKKQKEAAKENSAGSVSG